MSRLAEALRRATTAGRVYLLEIHALERQVESTGTGSDMLRLVKSWYVAAQLRAYARGMNDR